MIDMDIMNGIKIFHYFRITVGQGSAEMLGCLYPLGSYSPTTTLLLMHFTLCTYTYIHTHYISCVNYLYLQFTTVCTIDFYLRYLYVEQSC